MDSVEALTNARSPLQGGKSITHPIRHTVTVTVTDYTAVTAIRLLATLLEKLTLQGCKISQNPSALIENIQKKYSMSWKTRLAR